MLDNRGTVKEEVKEFTDVVGQDSLTRFDKGAKKKHNNKNGRYRKGNRPSNAGKQKNGNKE